MTCPCCSATAKTFQPQLTLASDAGPYGITLADVNGDGRQDIIVANTYGHSLSVLLRNGDGTFQPRQSYATGFADRVVAADVNGDGRTDLFGN
jgi:FG-GAP-like repeat